MGINRILVTGASGFVGTALCKALVQSGHDVLAALRTEEGASRLTCPHIVVGEIGASTDWRPALIGVTCVVHLAGRAHVMQDAATDALARYRRVNVEGTRQLVLQSTAAGVRRLVLMSSIKVNGESTAGLPFTEQDTPQPQDPYGVSKLEAERELTAMCDRTGLEWTILRPSLIYGPGAKGNLLALMRAIERGYPLPLGAIDNRRNLLALDNLIAGIKLCIEHPHAACETFLIADTAPVSSAKLARAIGVAMKRPARLVPVPPVVLNVAGSILGRREAVTRLTSSLLIDNRKIRGRLGWAEVCSFHAGIEEMVRGYMAEKR